MSGEAHVTIRFRTTLPVAMVADWPQALGLLDPKKMRDLQIEGYELEVDGDTRIGPPTPIDPFTAPVLVTLRRLICFFPGRIWRLKSSGSWLSLDFEPAWGEEATPENDKRAFAIRLNTGEAYRVVNAAVEDDPIPLDLMDPEKDRL